MMESPPLAANFFTNDFKVVDFLMVQRDYLKRALTVLKKRLPKEGTCSDPVIVDLVKRYVDLQFRLSRLEQLQLEKKMLMDSKILMDKVGLPAVDPTIFTQAFQDKFSEFIMHRILFMDNLEKYGLKKKKLPPKKLYSPPLK